jgi:hypothetical protein
MFTFAQPDFKFSTKHMKEFLSLVGIRFTAAATGFDAEEVRLHRRVSPGKQLHANIMIEGRARKGARLRTREIMPQTDRRE